MDEIRDCGHCGSSNVGRMPDGSVSCHDCDAITYMAVDCPECGGPDTGYLDSVGDVVDGQITAKMVCRDCHVEFKAVWNLDYPDNVEVMDE